ncbi:hypothetical protein [Mesonia sp. K7]|uniref:hypothetical protein n=1 Tax=Mesonia sp. K7 TaxID=2218606 RepID=UPI000DAAC141|nr:hypothetical protein [Mesonia sp. K7]PZD77040.1 hypothetical protein DNG35_10385 [Mesonia sp. K7]
MKWIEILLFISGAGLVIYSLVMPDTSAILQIVGVASLMIAVYLISRKVESKKEKDSKPANENERKDEL